MKCLYLKDSKGYEIPDSSYTLSIIAINVHIILGIYILRGSITQEYLCSLITPTDKYKLCSQQYFYSKGNKKALI
jgi:hypothetical protein